MTYQLFILLTFVVIPLANPFRRRAQSMFAVGKHRLNPAQAAAVEAAIARVVTAGDEFSGNTIQLPCRECGRRSEPPVPHRDSPMIPAERASLIPLASGYVVTAMCTRCDSPLISRVLDREYADHAQSLGVVNGEPLEGEMRDWLATL